MHSIFVHLADSPSDDVAAYFDARAAKGLREHWYFPDRADPVFTIRFPHGGAEYRDEENRRQVEAALGGEPSLTVQFDVGGKHPGHRELREFLAAFLARHPGIALDDLSKHIWSVEDLRSDHRVEGMAFADHESWRKHHKAHVKHV